ncbi:MAG: hypothetical protein DRJ32_02880 [Thermoprotei archaeon]|nr:MAG: hypothetical protein DRJ32_02880 [Thermoprotei archaeon]
MAGWGRSFWLAIKVIVFSILWSIIGGIIFYVGLLLGGSSLITYLITMDFTSLSELNLASIIVGVILVAIGLFIISLGSLASVIKVTSDEGVNECYKMMYYRGTPGMPPPGGSGFQLGFEVSQDNEPDYDI